MLYSATASCWRLRKSKPNGDIRNFQGSKIKSFWFSQAWWIWYIGLCSTPRAKVSLQEWPDWKKWKTTWVLWLKIDLSWWFFPLVKFSVSQCWMSLSPKWEWTARDLTFPFLSIFHVGVMVSSFTSIGFSWFRAEKVLCALNGCAWECSGYINRNSA